MGVAPLPCEGPEPPAGLSGAVRVRVMMVHAHVLVAQMVAVMAPVRSKRSGRQQAEQQGGEDELFHRLRVAPAEFSHRPAIASHAQMESSCELLLSQPRASAFSQVEEA